MLSFLEKLTLSPNTMEPDDVAQLHTAGVSDQAIEHAIYICTVFNIIDRVADTFNFHVPSAETFAARAGLTLERGYRFTALPRLPDSQTKS